MARGHPTKPPYDGLEAINDLATFYRGFKGQIRIPLGPIIICKRGFKVQGDPEIGQGPDFHKDTPPGEVFQIQVISLSETLRACR